MACVALFDPLVSRWKPPSTDLADLEMRVDSLECRAARLALTPRATTLRLRAAQARRAIAGCRAHDFSRELRSMLEAKIRTMEAELTSLSDDELPASIAFFR